MPRSVHGCDDTVVWLYVSDQGLQRYEHGNSFKLNCGYQIGYEFLDTALVEDLQFPLLDLRSRLRNGAINQDPAWLAKARIDLLPDEKSFGPHWALHMDPRNLGL